MDYSIAANSLSELATRDERIAAGWDAAAIRYPEMTATNRRRAEGVRERSKYFAQLAADAEAGLLPFRQ